MRSPRTYIRLVKKFLRVDLWRIELGELSKYKREFVEDTQVISLMLKTFKEEKIGLQSASLSYFCFMAVVPFIAVAFAITGGLGLADTLKEFLTDKLSDYPFIVETILNSADNILHTAESGWFGLFSALLFAWLIIWMMMCVERVFNAAWKVERSRKFVTRLTTDLIILILAPFIILLFSTGSIIYSNILDLVIPSFIQYSDSIKSFLGWAIFGGVAIMVISAMYKYIPAAKVEYKKALRAAIYAGIAFTIMQVLYVETQLLVSRANTVYGTVAAIPLFMIWLRFGFLILMYGCEFSYALQNIDTYKELLSQAKEEKTQREKNHKRSIFRQ